MLETSDGAIWFSDERELTRLDYATKRWTTFKDIAYQCATPDGTTWFATPDGAAVMPLSGDRCRFLIGLDRSCRPWNAAESELVRSISSSDGPIPADEIAGWLAANDYSCLRH